MNEYGLRSKEDPRAFRERGIRIFEILLPGTIQHLQREDGIELQSFSYNDQPVSGILLSEQVSFVVLYFPCSHLRGFPLLLQGYFHLVKKMLHFLYSRERGR